ncbi:prepilin peptidase [Granulicella sp. 5B5]|uniref:prepilin peptidase n=1 Tax=Granulicella sp. 5B5 TaxID=1617967 RepID=UPI0015F738FC|nr:A24 family peptidase [Granulicella sp. 5B5]QMV17575.1 prepilin peptidase [Granulicella sp. 5B5]
MISPIWFESAAFLLGLIFGSFLNVCISRLPAHESLWKPRSHCRSCGATIAWYDNLPVLSWVLLRAKCRGCGEQISWRYPVVEIAVGVWFALAASKLESFIRTRNGSSNWLPSYYYKGYFDVAIFLILGFLLIGLMVMDWQTHKLPDVFTWTGIAIGFLLACVRVALLGPHEDEVILHGRNPLSSPGNVVDAGNVVLTGPEHVVLGWLGAVVAAGCLLLVVRWVYMKLRGREGMGLGDAKLLAMIAAFLGFWPAMLALFVGVVTCSAYALVLLARGKAQAATRLPLGTFLCVGGLVAALVGPQLIAWYQSLL